VRTTAATGRRASTAGRAGRRARSATRRGDTWGVVRTGERDSKHVPAFPFEGSPSRKTDLLLNSRKGKAKTDGRPFYFGLWEQRLSAKTPLLQLPGDPEL